MKSPRASARITLLLLAVLTLAGVAGCREKHEPVKPTVAATPAQR